MGTIQHESLSSALFGKTRRQVLGLFFSRPQESFYLRQIARITGAGSGTVQREVKRLVEAGILTRSRRDRQILYQANKSCPIYKELRDLMIKTAGLADELHRALAPLAREIEIAAIYGSQADGTARPDSDVDLLIVGKVDEVELSSRIARAEETLNRTVNYTLLERGDFDSRRQEKNGFLDRVLGGDLIFIRGSREEI